MMEAGAVVVSSFMVAAVGAIFSLLVGFCVGPVSLLSGIVFSTFAVDSCFAELFP